MNAHTTPADRRVMGLFADDAQTAAAIEHLRAGEWSIEQVHGPIPSARISAALGLAGSRVGWYTLAGGIIGFFTGFALAAFTALRWSLIVSGKPIVALVPFFIVGFEFTILFAVFGNIIGLINEARLPDFSAVPAYDPRCSGDRYGIVVACDPERQEKLTALLTGMGAEAKVFE